MSRYAAMALCAALTLAAPAIAGSHRIIPYEGASEQTGSGGAKISADGIDYWISGTPPRKYQIIGAMRDDVNDYHGSHPGSWKVAKAIRAAGGDAAIIQDHSESMHQNRLPSGLMIGVHDSVTNLLVIKYLGEAR